MNENKENKKLSKTLRHFKSYDNIFRSTRSEIVSNDDNLDEIKTMRITDIFKNPNSIDAGKAINNLRLVNNELKKKVKLSNIKSCKNLDSIKRLIS